MRVIIWVLCAAGAAVGIWLWRIERGEKWPVVRPWAGRYGELMVAGPEEEGHFREMVYEPCVRAEDDHTW